jgi:hypothetical protein
VVVCTIVVEENGCGEMGKRNTKYQQTEKTKDFDILTRPLPLVV